MLINRHFFESQKKFGSLTFLKKTHFCTIMYYFVRIILIRAIIIKIHDTYHLLIN